MKKTRLTKSLSLIACIVLIAAVALIAIGCNDNQNDVSESSETPKTTVLGEGENHFKFNVVDAEGNVTSFEIRTDKQKVGEALLELELIKGDDGPYGLYVKTVNGITVDYDKDGKYWAFYINDTYGVTGVDMTDIENGATYAFKVEK